MILEFTKNSSYKRFRITVFSSLVVLVQLAGQLCLMSTILGQNRDIIFPKLSQELNLVTFSSIAERYLGERGYEPHPTPKPE
ncbi:MAG: hypothetical protein L3J12_09910 [Spirochaetales bacterium]|nr:hypothetical protein [Spirochaetales bacterium]